MQNIYEKAYSIADAKIVLEYSATDYWFSGSVSIFLKILRSIGLLHFFFIKEFIILELWISYEPIHLGKLMCKAHVG